MNYRKRKFFAGEYLHVYQRTIGGVNIFYDRIDRLVFFTIFATICKLYECSRFALYRKLKKAENELREILEVSGSE